MQLSRVQGEAWSHQRGSGAVNELAREVKRVPVGLEGLNYLLSRLAWLLDSPVR